MQRNAQLQDETHASMKRPSENPFRAIVTGVVIGAALAVVLTPVMEQPLIAIADASYSKTGCTSFGPSFWTFSVFFTLVNSGNANGVGQILFSDHQGPITDTKVETTYLISQGGQAALAFEFNSTDCRAWVPTVALISITKA